MAALVDHSSQVSVAETTGVVVVVVVEGVVVVLQLIS